MAADHPLTLTVEQAGKVLGVGRSTAYELVRSGDLKAIRLRRRIVIPVAHLAETLGVSHAEVRDSAQETGPAHHVDPQCEPPKATRSKSTWSKVPPTLF